MFTNNIKFHVDAMQLEKRQRKKNYVPLAPRTILNKLFGLFLWHKNGVKRSEMYAFE